MTRGFGPVSIFLAFVLFCAAPAGLLARVRPLAARKAQHTARQSLAVEHHRKAAPARPSRREHPARAFSARAEGRRSPRMKKVNAARGRGARPVVDLEPRRVVPAKPQPKLPAVSSVVLKNAPETALSGVSHPEELSDLSNADAPPSIPVPVVSVIRKIGDRPQLPSVEEAAATPAILPSLYDKQGRLVIPPAMKGSHEILVHQNEVADRDGLARVQDDSDLDWMRRRFMLVALPTSGALRVDDRLPVNRRYCRPWTAQFLVTLAQAHYARFHTPLQVNSAVRTVVFQQRLVHTNGNAAPAAGETASPHLTGQAIDLAKRGLSLSEIAWLRGYLLPLVQQGRIDVEEEFQQSCFHISVYKSYAPGNALPPNEIAVTHRDQPAALAIALQ